MSQDPIKTILDIVETGNTDEIETALDTLAELQAQREIAIASAGLARIKAQVEAEIELLTADISGDIKDLEGAIRLRVKELETTVKGRQLQAIFSERRSWNSDWLEAYAADGHPEVNNALKKTPSVTIRK